MTEARDDLRPVLEFLKRSRGFDFSGYKRPSLERRFQLRMQAVGVESYGDYLDFLQVHPEEYAALFDTILINVTAFFRDPAAWKYLDEQALPRLLDDAAAREIRVWSAGCASGEEAYSIAMLLVRRLGAAEFRERVKVYATDVDEEALATARHGQYSPKQVDGIPADLLESCFERTNDHYGFREDLRRSLIFGRNDLVQDAPISRIDVLLCRNVLMYFTAETQTRMLARFNFALSDTGVLFLGRSEMLLTHTDLFRPLDMRSRVFATVSRPSLPERLAFVTDADEAAAAGPVCNPRIREAAFDVAPVAQLIVDRDGTLALANQQARGLFGISQSDVGRPLHDLEISYRPVELRAAIAQAHAARRPVGLGTVMWTPSSGGQRRLDVQVAPLSSGSGAASGASVTFDDVSRHAEMRDELARSRRELEIAYEELRSTVEELETTNEELQSTNEELETTNEELQSTNEELETMNEELRSTNEELETMNEELRSTNEELETINDELRERSFELNDVNAFLEAILGSLAVGVVVVDSSQSIRIWNRRAEDLWGMRREEAIGERFLALDIGLPVDRLSAPLLAALGGEPRDGAVVLEATDRRGRRIRCAITTIPLRVSGGDVRGAILLMEARGDGGESP